MTEAKRQKYNGKPECVGDESGSLKIERIEHGPQINNRPGRVTLHCKCVCGRTRPVSLGQWRRGHAKTCGQHGKRAAGALKVVQVSHVAEAKKAPPHIKAAQSMPWVLQCVECYGQHDPRYQRQQVP